MKPITYRKLPTFIKKAIWNGRLFLDLSGYRRCVKEIRTYDNSAIVYPNIWNKAFRKLLRSGTTFDELANRFYSIGLTNTKRAKKVVDEQITLICVVKNEHTRIVEFIQYYRQLGIGKFVFVDDKSTDGTKEFLEKQDDVDLWTSDVAYSTTNRQAWIARLIDQYGFNRWYLVVDSDEFITYPNCENKPLTDIVSVMNRNGLKRAHCFLLDMYSKEGLFSSKNTRVTQTYTYFDKNGYVITDRVKLINISGGMRVRVFSFKSFFLSKYPLFFAEPGFVPCNSHFSFPFANRKEVLNLGVLRHYKFSEEDRLKYRERVEKKNFYNGSEEYSIYLDEAGGAARHLIDHNVSTEYIDSNSLRKLELPADAQIDFDLIDSAVG